MCEHLLTLLPLSAPNVLYTLEMHSQKWNRWQIARKIIYFWNFIFMADGFLCKHHCEPGSLGIQYFIIGCVGSKCLRADAFGLYNGKQHLRPGSGRTSHRKLSAIGNLGRCAIWDIRPKRILNSNLAKSRSSITSVSIVQSFWYFAQGTAVILPCSVQNVKTIGFWHGCYRRTRFREIEFKMSFGRIAYNAQHTGFHTNPFKSLWNFAP